ncbi:MAG: hypothetical protein ACYDER_20480, partial [Ktedonobacteraceae bacterium]
MRTHYSEQLGRDYVDDDMLDRVAVAEILSINSERTIPLNYVNTLANKGSLPYERQPNARKLLFQYKDVRNYIVSRKTYNGPRNLDTKRGENKIYSRHDEKTIYRSFQGESRSGTLERRE